MFRSLALLGHTDLHGPSGIYAHQRMAADKGIDDR